MKMRSNSELVISAVKWDLIFILCISISPLSALDTNGGTVAPLNADSPVPSAKILDSKEPPPEYYKGPPSNNNYDSYELKYNGQSHRPNNIIGSGYFNPYLSKHGFYGTINPKDRISIGGGYYSGSEFSGNGYGGSDRVRPYGSPQPVDMPPNSYNSNSLSNNFYGGNGAGSGFGSIGGSNGGAPGYDVGYDHGFGSDGNIWPDKMNHLSKSHLLPLAGAALIGIAAALLVNPVLLQLGTVATGKRRRRRDTSQQSLPPSKLFAHNIAYNGQIQQ